nr:hypothetical protein [Tanacetum cinerariifolium]
LPPAQYLVHQSLAASRRRVAASYWTAASDVAATSSPATAGQQRSTPLAIGQWRRVWIGSGSGPPRVSHVCTRVSHVCPRGIHVAADVDNMHKEELNSGPHA